MSDKKSIKCVDFTWSKASDLYELSGYQVNYKAGGTDQYRPVMGSLSIAPNTGKYFFEYRINCDNTRVGFCTDQVDLDAEMGQASDCASLNMQTGAVETNGIEVKRLWRQVTPISGGLMGFVFDSQDGTCQVYFNGEFIGTAFSAECSLQGKTVFPCVGMAGMELNNRNIGTGKKIATVTQSPALYKTMI